MCVPFEEEDVPIKEKDVLIEEKDVKTITKSTLLESVLVFVAPLCSEEGRCSAQIVSGYPRKVPRLINCAQPFSFYCCWRAGFSSFGIACWPVPFVCTGFVLLSPEERSIGQDKNFCSSHKSGYPEHFQISFAAHSVSLRWECYSNLMRIGG